MTTWLLVVCASLGGCGVAPTHDHELRMVLPLDPASLSPLYAFAQDQIALDVLWCQTLIGLDERNRYVPILVTRIPSPANGDVSADGLRITYHLRPDVKFADGVPLTAADVAFTYRAILDPANQAPTIDQYQRIATLTTPDDHIVVVRLRKRWSAAVHVLFAQADEAYGILPKHAFTTVTLAGSAWSEKPFGTGPFRVSVWHRSDRIELIPNPYYRPAPKLQRIVVRIVPDQTAAFNTLQTHEADVAELNPDNVRQAGTLHGYRIVRTPENGIRALYLQTAAGPTSDLHVRRAIAYALDPRALAKAWRGVYPAAHSVFAAPVVSWPASATARYPHDRARAERELDAAGWKLHGNVRTKDGQPLMLVGVTDATVPLTGRVAVMVQEQLAALGANVEIKAYTAALMSAPQGPLRTGHFSFTPSRYIGGSDPEQSLNLSCAQARSGGNYARFCSPRFEALFAKQMNASTPIERQRDFDAIAALVGGELPLIPLCESAYIEGVDGRVSGYRRNMLRFPIHAETWDAR